MKDNEQEKNHQVEMPEDEKVTRVSSAEEMFAILEGEAIKVTENGKTKIFYLKEEEKAEVAHQIAEMYLQKFPRPYQYGSHLSSSEGDCSLTVFHELTDEEMAIIQRWKATTEDPNEVEYELQEYLEEFGHTDLLDKLIQNDAMLGLDTLDSLDLDNPCQFTGFTIQFKNEDGTLTLPRGINCPLSDSQYIELLEQCLLYSNKLSMNMLVYKAPEAAQHVIRHMTWAYCNFQFETSKDSIISPEELKSVAQSILDPSVDILHLFDSEDIRIKAFLKRHRILKDED